MTDTTDLVPIPVPGTDRQVVATVVDGTPVVSLRHACDAIGLAFSGQLQKLKAKSWAGVSIIDTPSSGGTQQTVAIDRRTFTMWLATIDTNRISDDARPIVEAFQREAADALDAYFNDGGAINPRATEDQLGRVISQAQAQAGVLSALRGIVDPRHLETKGRLVLARALGEAPELDATTTPLYVWNYLQEKGLSKSLTQAKASGFGKRLKALYIVEHDRAPEMHHQEMPDGKVREACAYTEADRSLFDRVWARHYATEVAA